MECQLYVSRRTRHFLYIIRQDYMPLTGEEAKCRPGISIQISPASSGTLRSSPSRPHPGLFSGSDTDVLNPTGTQWGFQPPSPLLPGLGPDTQRHTGDLSSPVVESVGKQPVHCAIACVTCLGRARSHPRPGMGGLAPSSPM